MARTVTPDMLDSDTPKDVIIQAEPRKPETDPTLGIPVAVNRQGTPQHRLVAMETPSAPASKEPILV